MIDGALSFAGTCAQASIPISVVDGTRYWEWLDCLKPQL